MDTDVPDDPPPPSLPFYHPSSWWTCTGCPLLLHLFWRESLDKWHRRDALTVSKHPRK